MKLHRIQTLFIPLVSLLLASCGGAYQVNQTGSSGGRANFEQAERECNSLNTFVGSKSDNANQTVYITEKFRDCMASKGWTYTKTETKFWPVKSVSVD